MKKTCFKILESLLIIVVSIISLCYVRRNYDINSIIWHGVVFGTFCICFFVVLVIFHSKGENIKEFFETHLLQDTLLVFVCMLQSITVIIYGLLFHECFMPISIIYFIYLFLIATWLISNLYYEAYCIYAEEKNPIIYVLMWAFIFFANVIDCIL